MRVTADTTPPLPGLYSYAVPVDHVSGGTVIEASDLRLADQPIGQSSVEIRPLLLKSVLKQGNRRRQDQKVSVRINNNHSIVSIPVSPLKFVVLHFDNAAILYMSC